MIRKGGREDVGRFRDGRERVIWKLEDMGDSGLLGTLKLDRPRSISTKVSGKNFQEDFGTYREC